MLEGPRADRHVPDFPAFWCRGEAPQLAEGDFTRVRTSRLAPPPVRQAFRVSESQADFTTHEVGVNL
jgi:hypothetical protein